MTAERAGRGSCSALYRSSALENAALIEPRGCRTSARALFDAQAAVAIPGPTSGAKTLTLDEIAAQKQGGRAWGQVFHGMKTRGLLHESNLGQVVSRYEHQGSASVSSAAQKGKTIER